MLPTRCLKFVTLSTAMLSLQTPRLSAFFSCPLPFRRFNLPFSGPAASDRLSGVSSLRTQEHARRRERALCAFPCSHSKPQASVNRGFSALNFDIPTSFLLTHGACGSRQSTRNVPQRHYQTKRNMATKAQDGHKIVAYDPENVFKKILDGKIPCHKIFETEHVIAILDAFPAVEGHSLLIPKADVASVFDLDPETAANLYKELPRLCRAVQQATGCEGVNVLQNNGKAAGQVVFHAHVHVVPRYSGDHLFKQFASAKDMIQPAQAEMVLAKIKAHL
ncbi:putative Hit family protein involved in cell-cycle regulation [Toxoplasma gondii p89]|uniref:Putative Hit family protein involved in cell-cycle regulation n=2 Tax=Toxoplasma gondii TaxID=5811 RepID=A0A2T6IPK2_TOXGO|nr:putative Hit family protein involved in cell-cycle regulation [Toxoplasma gondii p89]PUA87272.1 putative Hit family protein involved in cell-cycle regulation [Toxoplasma gondii TgCATBr9]